MTELKDRELGPDAWRPDADADAQPSKWRHLFG